MLKKISIFAVALIVLFFLVNSVIMPWYVKHSDTAKVPKVIGMNYMDARKIIEDAGLEIKQGDVKYDENIPIGQIMDQNPPAEEKVKYGRRIYVSICGGEQLSEVPNLKGKSLRDAKFTLEQRGLKLGETVRKNTNEFPEDFVISQIIQPTSKVKKNSAIDLILSDGPVVGDLKIPSVTGKTLEEAKKIITDSKLKLGKVTYQTNNELPPGQIVDQYPKVDKSANENTTIDLFVSKKKAVIRIETDEAGNKTSPKDNQPEPSDETSGKSSTKETPNFDIKEPKSTDKKTNKDKKPTIKKEDSPKNDDKKKDDGTDN